MAPRIVEGRMAQEHTTVEGWTFFFEEDREEDNVKRMWFAVNGESGRVVDLDLLPYGTPEIQTLHRLIDLDFPTRVDLGMRRALREEDIEIAWLRARVEKLQKTVTAAGLAA